MSLEIVMVKDKLLNNRQTTRIYKRYLELYLGFSIKDIALKCVPR